jgi:hypothetical protein
MVPAPMMPTVWMLIDVRPEKKKRWIFIHLNGEAFQTMDTPQGVKSTLAPRGDKC